MIRPNRKLTDILKGRVLDSCETLSDGLVLRFTDHSTMHITTRVPVPEPTVMSFRNASISNVRQQDTNLLLEFESHEQSLPFQTSEPTASVMLRDANGSLEYAD
jgi:hypothetical protein